MEFKKVNIKTALVYFIPVILFLLLCSAFFYPQFAGEKVRQGDTISHRGMAKEVLDYREQTGDQAYWTGSMFSGMPSYQISGKQNQILKGVRKVGLLFFNSPIGAFVLAMITAYILLLALGCNIWISTIGAIAYSFTSYHFILWEAGHNTKLISLALIPLLFSGLFLTLKRKYLAGGALFAIGMALNLHANHLQMTYYAFLAMGFIFIFYLVDFFRDKKFRELGLTVATITIAVLIGLAANSHRFYNTLLYSEQTMRGAPILEKSSDTEVSSSETEGLAWDYAMRWSHNTLDLFTILVPRAVGGSSGEIVNTETQWYQITGSERAPLYWGDLPFTSGPVYFGAGILFLFLLGSVVHKGNLKWGLVAGVVVTLLLSMGSNFSLLTRPFFEYLPLYNKFRSPNSITALTAILMIIMAGVTLHGIFLRKYPQREIQRGLFISTSILVVLCLFFAFVCPGTFDFMTANDQRYIDQGMPPSVLTDLRADAMSADALRSLAIVLGTAAFVWLWIRQKASALIALIGIGLITVVDLWGIGKRYLPASDFEPINEMADLIEPRPVDEEILQDEDLSYRVLDLSINTFNSSRSSFFHKTIGGYHAAKLQRYQDIIDRYINFASQKIDQDVLNMLNTRYTIRQDQTLQRNPSALGNAWFVTEINWAATANEEIERVGDIDPANTAVIHEEFRDYLDGVHTGTGNIELISYTPNELIYQSNSPEGGLAIFSEVWYGPDLGWQAYIDDEPVDHIRINYILRGLKIPAGEHQIRFEFSPPGRGATLAITTIFSLLVAVSAVGLIYYGLSEAPPPGELPERKPAGKPGPGGRKTTPSKKRRKIKRK